MFVLLLGDSNVPELYAENSMPRQNLEATVSTKRDSRQTNFSLFALFTLFELLVVFYILLSLSSSGYTIYSTGIS